MYQVIITPEAIEHMGIAGLAKVLLSHIREGEEMGYTAFSIISIVGVSNLQLGNILKPVFRCDVNVPYLWQTRDVYTSECICVCAVSVCPIWVGDRQAKRMRMPSFKFLKGSYR